MMLQSTMLASKQASKQASKHSSTYFCYPVNFYTIYKELKGLILSIFV